MVGPGGWLAFAARVQFADLAPFPAGGGLWEKLGPDLRTRMIAALLGIVVLGLALFVLIKLASRFARRRLQAEARPSRFGPKYWAAQRFLKKPQSNDAGADD